MPLLAQVAGTHRHVYHLLFNEETQNQQVERDYVFKLICNEVSASTCIPATCAISGIGGTI